MTINLAKRAPIVSDVESARASLRHYFPRGSRVATVTMRGRGARSSVRLVAVGDDGVPFDASWIVAAAELGRFDRVRGGIVVDGVGTDPAFALVYKVARFVYNDELALRQSTL